MTVKATLVGINRHPNPTIQELGGARRDAVALWALFTDTIEELTDCVGALRASQLRRKPGIQGAAL